MSAMRRQRWRENLLLTLVALFVVAMTLLDVLREQVAARQESHAWLLWNDPVGPVHKVSKVQVEERCFLWFEGWTTTGNSIGMSVVETPCHGEKR